MIRVIHFAFLILSGLLSVTFISESKAEKVVKRVISANNGLNSGVKDIAFDEKGFAWFATENGLYRAHNTTLLRIHSEDKHQELTDQFFYKVISIGDNKLLTSNFQQDYIFDITTNVFTPLTHFAAFTDYLSINITDAIRLNNGTLLMLTDSGDLMTIDDLNQPATSILQLDAPTNFPYKGMTLIANNKVLVYTEHKIEQIDLFTKKVIREWNFSDNTINQIVTDDNQLWVASNRGLLQIDLTQEVTLEHPQFSQAIFSVATDQNQFWLATEHGVFHWLPKTNEIIPINDELKRTANFTRPMKIAIDDSGLAWIYDDVLGIALLHNRPQFIQNTIHSGYQSSIFEQDIWSIYSTNNELWLSSNNKLIRIEHANQQPQPITIQGLEATDRIYGIQPWDDKHLLLLTTHGLHVFNTATMQTQSFSALTNSAPVLANETIFKSTFDPMEKRWWFATSAGLYYWQKNQNQLLEFPLIHNPKNVLSVRSVFLASDRKLWIGGENIFGYIKDQEFVSQSADLLNLDSLPTISHIAEPTPNTLWFGTAFKGLFEYEQTTQKTTSLNQQWGTQCDSVFFIQPANKHYLTGCDEGYLIKYNTQTKTVASFDVNDGLISSDLNEGAVFYHPKQGAYVGTPEGAMLIDVENMQQRLAEDGVFLASTEIYYDHHTEINLLPTHEIHIKPDVQLITLQLASHDYLDQNLPHLQYRLQREGAEPNNALVSLFGHSQLTLSGLQSGQYRLEFFSVINGVNQTSLHPYIFIVDEHWWQSQQVKSLVVFTLFMFGVLIVIRHRARTEKFKRLNSTLFETQDRLHQALRGSESDLWEWHVDDLKLHLGNYTTILHQGSDKLVYSMEELKIHPDDQQVLLEKWLLMVSGKVDVFTAEYRQMDKHGQWRWLRTIGKPVKLNIDTKKVETVAGISTDITESKTFEDKANILAQAFENTSEGVLIFTANEMVTVSNAAAQKAFNKNTKTLMTMSFNELIQQHAQPISINTLLNGSKSWTGELTLIISETESCPVWLNLSVIQSSNDRESQYVTVFSDISERKVAEAELLRLANYDDLTGLCNRSAFSATLNQAINDASKANNRLALLFLDLDRFKHINDSFGHSMGDELLIEAAQRLSNCLPDSGLLCRFGGDEFVVLLRDAKNMRLINNIAQAMLDQIIAPFELFGREFFISTSIGISIWPDDAKTSETLIKNADMAMYHAKDEGRGRYQYYSSDRNQQKLYALKLENDLRKAIKAQQLELYYQTQVDVLSDDKVIGMEALLRWHHPEEGYISPDVFIPIAESSGLIIDIDRWVFVQACRQVEKWKQRYQQPFRISVNVSGDHFRHPDFVQHVQDILRQRNICGQYIGLEITEGVLMKELEMGQRHLKQLRALGVEISIDDFGTGYSSLAYLRNLSVSTLKIDRKFIIDIITNKADQAIVSSIVELARNLGLKVVAEGIEDVEQLEQLLRRGCYLMQGYYFSMPSNWKVMQAHLDNTIGRRETLPLNDPEMESIG
ncbi:EAL domain-containing protein [Parashewanella spongiae]|uniref:EAL domain-containing protein n=1 Tax=Parashewanella spongiae TaxID=342950 RepID=A0A3A6TWF5_9GAMM|nr:EAL domain-containing protein [Parashewanella spongiae]MCL1077060.1 EAL domain-containing protein [Parashewanella spongiae]RJY18726.1 EAL domain-containing protein [Parashewanella spongiae]